MKYFLLAFSVLMLATLPQSAQALPSATAETVTAQPVPIHTITLSVLLAEDATDDVDWEGDTDSEEPADS